MDTQILKHGHRARLFPILSDSQKEQKSLSIILATMISVRPFAESVLSSFGQKLGKRSQIECFTEVTLTNEVKNFKDRPDALIVVKSGKKSWSALVEAKAKKNNLDYQQLERYVQLAKANGIDALITISNQLASSPSAHPIWTKALPKNMELFHMSWAALLTEAFLLASKKDNPFENDNEAFMVSELIRYLEHPSSGMIALDQMNKEWGNTVKATQSGHPPNPKSTEVTSMIATWHQEARDVALLMTRKLRTPVSLNLPRIFRQDHAAWVDKEIKKFCEKSILNFELEVPDTVDDILVEADFLRRSITASMKIPAPTDRARNSSRLNWLLRQLKSSDLSKISILCTTKGRGAKFGAMAHEINTESDEFKALNEITSFTVEMASDLSAKFNSRKKFVEELEDLIPAFYDNVGQHLKEWTPSPSKKLTTENEKNANKTNSIDSSPSISKPPSEHTSTAITLYERPEWTRQWANDEINNLARPSRKQ